VTNHRTLSTHNAMFIEDDGDVARRMEGRVVNLPRLRFDGLDQESLMRLMVFQYLIGTPTSRSGPAQCRRGGDAKQGPLPDRVGLRPHRAREPPYAVPDPRFNISSVRERLYRGPCKSVDELEPHLAVFRARQADVVALVDSTPISSRAVATGEGVPERVLLDTGPQRSPEEGTRGQVRPQVLM